MANGNVSPKVANGAAAGGISGQLSVVLIWALGHWVTLPPEIATAIVGIIVPVVSGLAGYYTPHDEPAPQQPPRPSAAPPLPTAPQQGLSA